ncbi:MAG: glycosyl hydrolase [Lachnospiraceae bacterium]
MHTSSHLLTNPAASEAANRLYSFLISLKGKGILSGQQECSEDKTKGDELSYIQKVSGHLPAILGLDYINNDFAGVNKRAKLWHEKGGIVSICWHWGIPPYGLGYRSSQESVDMTELLTPGTVLHQGLLDNLDMTARALSELCKENIPVLWRPLHEFDGAWFWWGKGGSAAFISLWHLMYERFTKVHHLNNLIWVLGYSHEMHDGWYPGDDYVDCIGGDAYTEGIHEELYHWIKKVTDKQMPVCHHENGSIPEPGLLAMKHIDWCWFLTWHTIHIHEQNSPDYLHYVYNHPYVITLERLQELRTIEE